MISESQVQSFLEQFHTKMKIFGILYRDDRGKNQKTLEELEIVPSYRKVIIENLKVEDIDIMTGKTVIRKGKWNREREVVLPKKVINDYIRWIEIREDYGIEKGYEKLEKK